MSTHILSSKRLNMKTKNIIELIDKIPFSYKTSILIFIITSGFYLCNLLISNLNLYLKKRL